MKAMRSRVVGVHVRLDLEDEAGDFVAAGLHRFGLGGLGARRRGVGGDRLDQRIDAEFLERRSEIDRRQVAVGIGRGIECRIADPRQLGFLAQPGERLGGEEVR